MYIFFVIRKTSNHKFLMTIYSINTRVKQRDSKIKLYMIGIPIRSPCNFKAVLRYLTLRINNGEGEKMKDSVLNDLKLNTFINLILLLPRVSFADLFNGWSSLFQRTFLNCGTVDVGSKPIMLNYVLYRTTRPAFLELRGN